MFSPPRSGALHLPFDRPDQLLASDPEISQQVLCPPLQCDYSLLNESGRHPSPGACFCPRSELCRCSIGPSEDRLANL